MQSILLCSRNIGKIREFMAMAPPSVRFLSLKDVGILPDLPETGDTLEENALQKARFGYEQTGSPSIADDSGLEVDALGGDPGVRSARYAGEEKNDMANIKKLLREMEGKELRNARFRTVIAFVHDKGEQLFEGLLEGEILEAPCGEHGFGYDPIFRPTGSKHSLAEMDSAEKNSISHRSKAVRGLFNTLNVWDHQNLKGLK